MFSAGSYFVENNNEINIIVLLTGKICPAEGWFDGDTALIFAHR